MGKKYTARHKNRRKLTMCETACDRILGHLADVSKDYDQVTKPVSMAMQELGSMTQILKDLVHSTREHI